jgi:hypothetical protein
MKQDAFDTSNVRVEQQHIPLQSAPIEHASPVSSFRETAYSTLSTEALTMQCSREIENYRSSESCNDEYGLELLRRAIVQRDEEAWAGIQQCFYELVHGWLCRHPKRDVACHLESEEYYVAQTFERFRQVMILTQQVDFVTLASALRYLHASLNEVMLETLRAYARPREVMLPETVEAGEPQVEDKPDRSDVWKAIQMMLSNDREKRLTYLLFHCGLKPEEIIRFYPQEWSDVREIYRLRCNIMERLLHNADQLSWGFG